MREDEVLAEFRAAGALLDGHFVLSSGLRSPRHLECARALMSSARAQRLTGALARTLPDKVKVRLDLVVSAAIGGIVVGHEMGRALGIDALFVERPAGTFELRRGFSIAAGQKVLLVVDVVTSGLSARAAIAAVRTAGGDVIAAAALVDRSNGAADLGVPFYPLIRLDVPSYAPDALPAELAALPAVKPGSRATA